MLRTSLTRYPDSRRSGHPDDAIQPRHDIEDA